MLLMGSKIETSNLTLPRAAVLKYEAIG